MERKTTETHIPLEDAITLSAAARLLGAGGKPPHPSTLWRWCRQGMNGIRLGYAKRGRRIVTSRTEIERFMARLAEYEAEKYESYDAAPFDEHHEPTCPELTAAEELERAGI